MTLTVSVRLELLPCVKGRTRKAEVLETLRRRLCERLVREALEDAIEEALCGIEDGNLVRVHVSEPYLTS